MANKAARVLTIAGSDSGGGAGIQADIKTITCMGGYAASAITALTAQNTHGVSAIYPASASFVTAQIEAVLSDIGADCIKTGMLLNAEIIVAIAHSLQKYATHIPLVLDPVMVAKGGAPLLEPDAITALRTHLIPRATLLTPNLPEASLLIGRPVLTLSDMHAAITDLRALGAQAVLLKGGHLSGDTVTDMLITSDHVEIFTDPRIDSKNTHGTGCTLASAIACGIAQHMPLPDAVARARHYVRAAMSGAPQIGSGHGPLWHNITFPCN